MTKHEHRLRRQFTALERLLPAGRGILRRVQERRFRLVRVPLALALCLGGFLGFLPVLGFWMLPVGLLLLALDFPALQPATSAAAIRIRRRIGLWRRRLGR